MILAYVDCFGGLSGTTLLEALISVGLSRKQVEKALADLPGGEGHVASIPELAEFRKKVAASELPMLVKQTADAVMRRLQEAETAVQNEEDLNALRVTGWQEWNVGELRAAVGVVLGLSLLRIKRVECSPLRIGGWQKASTGEQAGARRLIFSPITAEILCGSSVPVYGSDQGGENVTPVGAALVATLASKFGPLPSMTIGGIGYGKEEARQTRVFIGQSASIEVRAPQQVKDAGKAAIIKIEGAPKVQELVASGVAAQGQEVGSVATASKGVAVSQAFVAGFEEWVALSIKGHQQSGRQRL